MASLSFYFNSECVSFLVNLRVCKDKCLKFLYLYRQYIAFIALLHPIPFPILLLKPGKGKIEIVKFAPCLFSHRMSINL